MSPREATLQAMREVSGPVVAIALVLSSVFIPVAFVVGIKGRLFQQFALTIAVSVIISAFNALTLEPGAERALLLKPSASSGARAARLVLRPASTAPSPGRPIATSAGPACSCARRRSSASCVLRCSALGAGVARRASCRRASCPTRTRASSTATCSCPTPRRCSAPTRRCKQIEEVLGARPTASTATRPCRGFSILTQTRGAPTRASCSSTSSRGASAARGADRRRHRADSSTASWPRFPRRAPSPSRRRRSSASAPSGGFDVMLEDRVGMTVEELARDAEQVHGGARPSAPS